jgi:hypothetical protein
VSVSSLKPGDHGLQLVNDKPCVFDRPADAVGIAGTASALAGDLSLHKSTQRNADRRGAESGAKRAPRLVADLNPSHAIVTSAGYRRWLVSVALPTPPSHVYAVYDASPVILFPDGAQ